MVAWAAGGAWGMCEQLINALARTDTDGDAEAARAAVETFGASPQAVVRIDERVRYVPWRLEHHSPVLTAMAAKRGELIGVLDPGCPGRWPGGHAVGRADEAAGDAGDRVRVP